MKSATSVGFLSVQLISLLIAIISLTLLVRRVREASHGKEWRTCRVSMPV
ncbi:MAG TPA: hypothetical protein VKA82_23885 [Rubrobacter sp.]|nr:hypothetical protein [Rubrobacter sp.]